MELTEGKEWTERKEMKLNGTITGVFLEMKRRGNNEQTSLHRKKRKRICVFVRYRNASYRIVRYRILRKRLTGTVLVLVPYGRYKTNESNNATQHNTHTHGSYRIASYHEWKACTVCTHGRHAILVWVQHAAQHSETTRLESVSNYTKQKHNQPIIER